MMYRDPTKTEKILTARRQSMCYLIVFSAVLAGGFLIPPLWFFAPVLLVLTVSNFVYYDPQPVPYRQSLQRAQDRSISLQQ